MIEYHNGGDGPTEKAAEGGRSGGGAEPQLNAAVQQFLSKYTRVSSKYYSYSHSSRTIIEAQKIALISSRDRLNVPRGREGGERMSPKQERR